ncbi:EAL domain, c-di-GMP-specific phosphodiesterase class I (or its enzymatically inactive variant) [Xaviernesmea oryzae]|uniref:EAL domain, c-di-GMP-specific phosphodiesterase class I (Or its enzymatically inactive variant) n=1 Tax=Xaviernesmea oryzae TaxID=464029 RepID=A0A1X7GS17_9HYPH|nr:EAL domain-containing protein [Xaviernesmea oryzae]SMF73856.1 EAL domain, c-di-GMP-specific phosphodiesterase class I (or its enzymatically inactive variant) [Xaviernesmea oryzae]
MAPRSIFANLVRGENGAFSTIYGPFKLQSALQPIFRPTTGAGLEIEAFEGLVRVSRDGEPVSPGDFFPLVPPSDMADTDSILRTIHILNTGRLGRSRARIFVKFHPGLFRTPHEMRQEVERIKLAGHEAGIGPDRIVCEISEKSGATDDIVVAFAGHMRAIGFRIAIDDYGAGDSDLARLKRIAPDYVKFDASWVRDFLDNSAGYALLRVIVRQMLDDGIEPIFEGLEEVWQVDLCEELGVPLMQGYALARPEIAPTTFNESFPESRPDLGATPLPRMETSPAAGDPAVPPLASHIRPALAKPARAFGRRRSTHE